MSGGLRYDAALLLNSRGLSTAILAAAMSATLRDMDLVDSIQFGAVASLATSTGDTIMLIMGISDKTLNKYNPLVPYFDPTDFVGAGAVTAGLLFVLGARGSDLLYGTAVAAIAGGVGTKLSGILSSMISPSQKSDGGA
jgi:hypothetical protein